MAGLHCTIHCGGNMGWEGLLVREVWLPMLPTDTWSTFSCNLDRSHGSSYQVLWWGGTAWVVGWGRCMARVWWGLWVQSRWVARVKPITVEVRSSTIRADED